MRWCTCMIYFNFVRLCSKYLRSKTHLSYMGRNGRSRYGSMMRMLGGGWRIKVSVYLSLLHTVALH